MGDFKPRGGSRFGDNRGGSKFGGGGGGGFRGGGGGFRGGRDDRDTKMYQAVCAECQKSCEVPFRPTSDRPVYCRDCFAKRGGGESRPQRGDFENRNFSKPRFDGSQGSNQGGGDVKRQLEIINSKLDKLVSLLGAKASAQAPAESKKETLGQVVTKVVKVKKSASKKSAKKK